jgi:hypothetical protein
VTAYWNERAWAEPARNAGLWGVWLLLPLGGCVGHVTAAVARSDRHVTYVQRAVEYQASDTLVDCRINADESQSCSVISLEKRR